MGRDFKEARESSGKRNAFQEAVADAYEPGSSNIKKQTDPAGQSGSKIQEFGFPELKIGVKEPLSSSEKENDNRSLRFKTPEQLEIDRARGKLDKAVYENIPSEKEREKLFSDLNAFERRSIEQRLFSKELIGTYEQLTRLLVSESEHGVVSMPDRVLAVETFAHHLADPSNIDQGWHKTCNVSTLQEHIMNESPSKLAGIMATVALTGSWIASDGKKIFIDRDSLQPGREERGNNLPLDGKRTFATQLLNLALANDHGQRQSPPMYYSQENVDGEEDTGERLRFADAREVTGRELGYSYDTVLRSPAMNVSHIAAELERLTGEKGVIFSGTSANEKDIVHVDSPELLERALADQLEKKSHPILFVDSSAPILKGNNGKGWHVLSVTGYDPARKEVRVSNQWGKESDKLVSVSDLHRAVNPDWNGKGFLASVAEKLESNMHSLFH